VTGIDIDPGMIRHAETNARSEGATVTFLVASFNTVPSLFPHGAFDAVTCVGNSLSQLNGIDDVTAAIDAMARVCRPGGIIVLHILNYRSLMRHAMVPRPLRVVNGAAPRLFFQKVFLPRERSVDVLTIKIGRGATGWTSDVDHGRLLPIMPRELVAALNRSGCVPVENKGDYGGTPFSEKTSWDLIIVAQRKTG
jgi:SAM-dependent methyltransferase